MGEINDKEEVVNLLDKINEMRSCYWIENPSGCGFSFDMKTDSLKIYATSENFINLKIEDILWIEKMVNQIKNNRYKNKK